MQAKKYICLSGLSYVTGITVNDVRIFIDFKPQGSGIRRISTFIAYDQALVDAMENDPRNGVIWAEEVPVDVLPDPDAPQADDAGSIISVEAVSNFQAARKYLITNHGLVASDIPNQETVLAAAKTLNIVFEGWTPKSSQA